MQNMYIIGFIELSVVLGIIILRLTFSQQELWYKKSATFYNLMNVSSVITLIAATSTVFFTYILPLNTLERWLYGNNVENTLLKLSIYDVALLFPLSMLYSGVKSFKVWYIAVSGKDRNAKPSERDTKLIVLACMLISVGIGVFMGMIFFGKKFILHHYI